MRCACAQHSVDTGQAWETQQLSQGTRCPAGLSDTDGAAPLSHRSAACASACLVQQMSCVWGPDRAGSGPLVLHILGVRDCAGGVADQQPSKAVQD